MNLLQLVVSILREHAIPHAIIGAGALAAHGVARSTMDTDLLTTEVRVLEIDLWKALPPSASVKTHAGDLADPLAGLVRILGEDSQQVDIVVGRYSWQTRAVDRASSTLVGREITVPIVGAADLILLKLYAGGPQDAWDIVQLLTGGERSELLSAVERDLPQLPARCHHLWSKILADLAPAAGSTES